MKEKMNRIIGGVTGGFVGEIVYAIARLIIEDVSISGWGGLVMLFLPGLLARAILGVLYPKPFIWVIVDLLDEWLT